MSLITSRLLQNVPSDTAFKRMICAGLDAPLFAAFARSNGDLTGIIFANVQPDLNGDYDFVQMNALNKRMASDLALSASFGDGVRWFPTRTTGREVAVIDGGRAAQSSNIGAA